MRAVAMQPRTVIGLIALVVSGAALAQQSPDELLERIGAAVNDITYRGTLIHSVDGNIDTMRVLHSTRDGVVREKLVALDGEGREVVRMGGELVCLFPDQRLKIVETESDPGNRLVRPPLASSELHRYYVLEDHGPARVAGRDVQRYFVKPRDGLRYGHRLWLDKETLLPLRMAVIGRNRVVEEIRFTNVEIGIELPDLAFKSDIDSSAFKVIRASSGPSPRATETRVESAQISRSQSWPAEASPGFRFRSTLTETVQINGQVAQRIVFSDGLATVSVFIATRRADADPAEAVRSEIARLGAAHTYRRHVGDKTVTLMGEVPVETLRQVADLTERQIIGATAPGAMAPTAED